MSDVTYRETKEEASERGSPEKISKRLVAKRVFLELDKYVTPLRTSPQSTGSVSTDSAICTLRNTINLIRSYKVLVKEGQSGLSGTTITGKRWSLPHCEALDIFFDSSDAFLLLITSEGRIIHASSTFYSLLAYSPESVVAGDKGIGDISEQLQNILESLSKSDVSPNNEVPLPLNFKLNDNLEGRTINFESFLCRLKKLPSTCQDEKKVIDLTSRQSDDSDKKVESHITDNLLFKNTFMVTSIPAKGVSDCRDLLLADYGCDYSFNIRIEKNGIIASVDAHAAILLGYTVEEIVDMSVFDFIHPYHVNVFGDAISKMIENGFAETKPYRLMTKGGKWIWCQSRCFLSVNPWTNESEHFFFNTHLVPLHQLSASERCLVNPLYLPYELPTVKDHPY